MSFTTNKTSPTHFLNYQTVLNIFARTSLFKLFNLTYKIAYLKFDKSWFYRQMSIYECLGIFQAVYTAGVVLPKPVGTCR